MKNNLETILKQGNDLLTRSKFTAAIKCFEYGLTLYPDNETILFKLAELYDIKDRYDDSISTYMKLIRMQPENITPYIEIANIYFYIKREYDEAEKFYLEAIKVDSEYLKSYQILTDLYIRRQKYSETIDLLTADNIYNKLDSPILANLGKAYEAKNHIDKAIEVYHKSISLNRGYVASYILLSELYFKLKDYSKVVELSGFVVDICPDVEDARMLLEKANKMLNNSV